VGFSWRTFSGADLLERFPEETLGLAEWQRLVRSLEGLGGDADPEEYLRALEDFIDRTPNDIRPTQPECRLFISHQQKDVAYAQRIAFLATQERLDYWLDVHDPVLTRAQQTFLLQDPRYPILLNRWRDLRISA
jgi:hypothetical protein